MSDYSKVDLVNTGTLNSDTSRAIAMTAAQAADDRKGGDIVLLGVAEVSYLADYFVMVTGFSRVQVRAISQSVQDKIEIEWQRLPLRVEGQAEGSWVLLDYGDVIVHVLMAKEREFYNLEAFWGHAERIEFSAAGLGRE
ncbi:ribosome silencing factor [Microcoleus sp. FACHB-68]|uniref:ribosome silencing factor n=1 Tax=Microcoleus sp. FACHB-68 TaxID=2692826 RepID=UPI001683EE65|nr:ribosome silencing factor [Microcoleus sp. FACHB-68]MBD1937133.1 ribosome silencing factor [Microcoleus sp. FACHB-68]